MSLNNGPELTREERQYWQTQAAYWGVREEICTTGLDYAIEQRRKALIMLGMISLTAVMEVANE